MYIVLSQIKDFRSEYNDNLFQLYHFPAKYLKNISTGDVFVYNQPSHSGPNASSRRYYFGTGTIGKIYTEDDSITYYAELKQCKNFYNNVPIKLEDNTYIEQIGFENKRQKPDWQNSIRQISFDAYKTIINMSGGLMGVTNDLEEEEIKFYLKNNIDQFYLKNHHQSLIDIIQLSLSLAEKYGILVK